MDQSSTADGVLEDLVDKLPTVDFGMDDSDEDSSDNDSNSLSVFSRSQHLQMLGIHDSEEQPEHCDRDTQGEVVLSKKQPHEEMSKREAGGLVSEAVEKHLNESEHTECSTALPIHVSEEKHVVERTDVDWKKFKQEFSATFQASQEKLAFEQSASKDADHISRDGVHEQLLINAIAMMHSSEEEPQERSGPSAVATQPVVFGNGGGGSSLNNKVGELSPLRQRRRLLSQGTLETIHESEIDKVLEMAHVPNGGDDPKEKQTTTVEAAPLPKFVWDSEDKGSGGLMQELEQLSVSQSVEPSMAVEATTSPGQGHLQSPSKSVSKNDNPTVFLDLRHSAPQDHSSLQKDENGTHSLSSTAQRLLSLRGTTERSRSSSESDDGDDPYAWITQRKQIKGVIKGAPHISPPSPHNLHQFHKRVVPNSHSSVTEQTQATSKLRSLSDFNKNESSVLHKKEETQETKIQPQVPIHSHSQKANSEGPVVVNEENGVTVRNAAPVVLQVSSFSSFSEEVSIVKDPNTQVERNDDDVRRQRSTDSLTLSSSFSESETLKSEAADPSSTDLQVSSNTSKPPSSPTKKALKRKAKKLRKKEKAKEANKRKKRSHRVRTDSLTTSSDEEHSSSGMELISSTSTEQSIEGSGESVFDEEKLKLHLLKRIQSKKPPSHFNTPATEPIYHEDVTFEPQCVGSDPTASTDAMLVLSLSDYGLASLQDVDELRLSLESRIALHLLILTWLSHTAASSVHSLSSQTSSLSNGSCEAGEESVCASRPPFVITGLQLSILDGRPMLLVGIAYRDKLRSVEKESSFNACFSFELLRNYLKTTSVSKLLHSLTNNDSIQRMVSLSVLKQLNSVFEAPLSSLFSLHDDPSPLTTPVSFYWFSGYHPSCLPTDESLKSGTSLATTICTLGRTSLQNIELVFSVLYNIYSNGFDLAGLRLVYGEIDSCSDVVSYANLEHKTTKDLSSAITLALAIRGPDAVYRWMDVVGPKDSNLAKVTDPDSLNAQFNSTAVEELHCLRTPYSAPAVLAKWFGGRACLKTGSLLGISDARTKHERRKRQRVRFSESESDDTPPSPLPDAAFPPLITNRPRLVAQPYSKILLVVSPRIPPSFYSSVLSCCGKLGFDIFGAKRIRLNSKRATGLRISGSFIYHFAPSSTPPSPAVIDSLSHPLSRDSVQNSPPLPSILLVLARESALIHSVALKKEMANALLSLEKRNTHLKACCDLSSLLDCPESLVHVIEYTEDLVKIVGSFSTSPTVTSSQLKLEYGWDEEDPLQDELCFVAVPHNSSLTRALNVLDDVFKVKHEDGTGMVSSRSRKSYSSSEEESGLGEFELLGFKILPQLTRFYAKRLCPIPSDDSMYYQAVQHLSDEPATLLIFRGIGCNRRLQNTLSQSPKSLLHAGALEQKLQVIVSRNFQEAYTLSTLFFTDRELFHDTPSWTLASYVPHSWLQDSDILQRMQRTPPESFFSVLNVSLLKPKLFVKVLDKLSRAGFKFVGMRLAEAVKQETEAVLETLEKSTVPSSEDDVRLVVCVQRKNAVWHLQHILRPFNEVATRSPSRSPKELITWSKNFLAAISDTKQYFPSGVCCQQTPTTKEYNVKCETPDNFTELVLPVACKLATKPSLLGYVSPLMETTAMIFPPCLVTPTTTTRLTTAGFIEVLDFLTQAGFVLCGLKMVLLSEETCRALSLVCDSLHRVEDLMCDPSLVVVLQRDNAASCCHDIFRSALQTCYHGNRGDHVSKLLTEMIVPKDAKQAKELVGLFGVCLSS